MDPDTLALLTVTRGQTKAARRHLSTLARLYAELDEKLAEIEDNGQPKEAHQNGTEDDSNDS